LTPSLWLASQGYYKISQTVIKSDYAALTKPLGDKSRKRHATLDQARATKDSPRNSAKIEKAERYGKERERKSEKERRLFGRCEMEYLEILYLCFRHGYTAGFAGIDRVDRIDIGIDTRVDPTGPR